jgi:Type ISP C-terminal specificity domain
MTGRGIICFISSYSYLGDPSFVVMRQRFLSEFDKLWFDCMNGDSRETGKLTPAGKPDPSVFSTEYNREGIKLGTTIGLMVRKARRADVPQVYLRDFWGTAKRSDLVESLAAVPFGADYRRPMPEAGNRFSFRSVTTSAAYRSWPRVTELAQEEPISGLQEMRQGALIDIDREQLERRIAQYLDPEISWQDLLALETGLTKDAGRFEAAEAREKLLRTFIPQEAGIRPYALMPFDYRWAYYTPVRPLWNEPRPRLAAQQRPGNFFFVTRRAAERPSENAPMLVTSALPDYHLLRPNVVAIPVRALGERSGGSASQHSLPAPAETPEVANLSARARGYLASLGISGVDDPDSAALLWLHALAIGYTPEYLSENADGVRTDFPRVPLPGTAQTLQASAKLGRELADLLLPERQVEGVTTGAIRPELKQIAVISRAGGGALDPGAGALEVRAGWGHLGRRGITMPGRGSLRRRAYSADERETIPISLLGGSTFDVYLNEVAFWQNVPVAVWEYTIGGYQVLKKWLSYREAAILGRGLSATEVRELTSIAGRISAILLLGPALRESYEAVKAAPCSWPSGTR